jgi:hypothetical protein
MIGENKMKALFLIVLFLLFSCQPQIIKKTETIVKETNNPPTLDYKVINEPMYPLSAQLVSLDTKIYNFIKNISFSTNTYAGNGNGYINVDTIRKQNDFFEGVFYFDNSINSNDILYQNVWRTLDLSNKISGGAHRVVMYVKVLECGAGGTNETCQFKFRTPNSILIPKVVSQKFGDVLFSSIEITTDNQGKIEWCYSGNNAYDAKNEFADPDYHDYRWFKCQIWLLESWKVDIQ